MSRAQVWVNNHVPYNQQGTYDGYRQDTGGFISMCWELARPGLPLSNLHTAAHNVNKDQLEAGDAMNCDGKHALIFGGWTSGARSEYIGI